GKIAKQIVSPPSEPALLSVLQQRETILLKAVSNANTSSGKDQAIEQLAIFYIYKMGNIDKAMGLLPTMAHQSWGFDIKMHAILGNKNLTNTEKASQLQALLASFPDEKQELVELIDF